MKVASSWNGQILSYMVLGNY